MRPYPEEVLRALQAGIGAHFAPEVKSSYAQAQLMFSGLLFMIVQRDYDTAVPDLVEGNRTLRELLAEAARALEGVAGDEATERRAALANLPTAAPTLKLSDLRREHEELRAALGALAPLVEPAADVVELAPLRDVRARAFAYLSADAKRRTFPILSA